jgi:hypothetical protein
MLAKKIERINNEGGDAWSNKTRKITAESYSIRNKNKSLRSSKNENQRNQSTKRYA